MNSEDKKTRLKPWQCFTQAYGKRTSWRGRVTRWEYCWFLLFWWIIIYATLIVLVGLDTVVTPIAMSCFGNDAKYKTDFIWSSIFFLTGLVQLYYLFKMATMRAHDVGLRMSLEPYFIALIILSAVQDTRTVAYTILLCIISESIYLVVMMFMNSQRGMNQWGINKYEVANHEEDAVGSQYYSRRYKCWTISVRGIPGVHHIDLEDLAKKPMTIGRGRTCGIVLNDKKAARIQCILGARDEHPIICNMKEKAKMHVNGKHIPLHTIVDLHAGDVVTLGSESHLEIHAL